MGDNKNLAIMAAEAYKIAIPEVVVPKDASTWVREMFPQLITSIYMSCNKNIECLVVDFNKSIDHLKSQVNRMEDTIKQMTRTHTAEMKEVRDTLHTKQYQVDNNATVISDLKETINKNESYSRRDNLIFGGFNLDRNDKRSCDEIVREDIFIKALNMSRDEASAIKFVRCHFLTKRSGDNRSSIIARFESYRQRTMIWNKRRSLRMVYVTEDFPYVRDCKNFIRNQNPGD